MIYAICYIYIVNIHKTAIHQTYSIHYSVALLKSRERKRGIQAKLNQI